MNIESHVKNAAQSATNRSQRKIENIDGEVSLEKLFKISAIENPGDLLKENADPNPSLKSFLDQGTETVL